MKKIYYIAHYDPPKLGQNRVSSRAAIEKIEYLLSALNAENIEVTLISAGRPNTTTPIKETIYKPKAHLELVLLKGDKGGGRLRGKLATARYILRLFWYLLRYIHKDDTVLVYHSLVLMRLIRLLKRLKHFRLILEVEEIYADVKNSEASRKKELTYFRLADGFLFPTQLLEQMCNPAKKPYAIVHGIYRMQEIYAKPVQDGKVHCVYAGTLNVRKGGAVSAVSAAEFLPPNYHIHILGNASEEETAVLIRTIAETAGKGGGAVTYEGALIAEDYAAFLQCCQIGLSTQRPDGIFNATSFPSKILSYLSNGLRVVSCRIAAVETSAVSELVTYYEEQTPQAIAAAILAAQSAEPPDAKAVFARLDERFRSDIAALLQALEH